MEISVTKLANMKVEMAKSKDKNFDPRNYYWVISDDVRQEFCRTHRLVCDTIGGKPVLKMIQGIEVRMYDHLHTGVLELKKVQPSIYISTAGSHNDWLREQMMKDYCSDAGRGGYTYLKPKFEIDDREPDEMSLYPKTLDAFVIPPRCGKSFATLQSQLAALDLLADGHRIRYKAPEIDRVIYNNPATIVFWKDGTKTVVKAQGEAFDEEKGLAMAICKKIYGNTNKYYNKLKKHLPKVKAQDAPEDTTVSRVKALYHEGENTMADLIRLYSDMLTINEKQELIKWAGEDDLLTIDDYGCVVEKNVSKIDPGKTSCNGNCDRCCPVSTNNKRKANSHCKNYCEVYAKHFGNTK